MGDVYECTDLERGTRVALKSLRHLDPEGLLRFKDEFRRIADLHHPNLVDLYELVADAGHWFFTMELIDGAPFVSYVRGESAPAGGALADTLESGDPADSEPAPASPAAPLERPDQIERLRDAARQLAEGLCVLHRAGKLHRDIKPSNVLVTPEGRVVILDFGLVAETGGGWHDGQVVGTPAYMAPEQGRGGAPSAANDWYSVGVMIFEALTGRLPLDGPAMEVMNRKLEQPSPAVRELWPAAPEDLAALCDALLVRNPAARPTGAEVCERLGASAVLEGAGPELPIVGRDRQLETLRAAWEDSAVRPVAVLVEGASGMGKSSLVDAFLHHLRATADPILLRGRCYEREAVPYQAVDSVVDALSRGLARLPPDRRDAILGDDGAGAARLFPVLAPLAPAPAADATERDPTELRRRGFAGLAAILRRMARPGGLVLFIDDLQWGDADSALLFEEILDPERPAPIFLCATARSDELDAPAVRALLANGPRRIELASLTPAEASAMASALIDDPAAAATAAAECGGNPFFLHELARHPDPAGAGGLRLEEAIQRRAAALPPAARALLEVLAVAGRPIALGAAAQAAALAFDLHAAVADLRAAHLLRASRGDRVDTFHDCVRDAVLRDLTPAALERHHAALAAALQDRADADPETLARHWLGAGELARARRHVRAAAQRAEDALAFDQAARLYQLALELEPETRDRAGLERRLADALAAAGRSREAGERYAALAPGDGSIEDLRLSGRAAEQYLISGHFADGVAALRRVAPHLGVAMPRGRAGLITALIGRRVQLRLRGQRVRAGARLGDRERAALELCGSATLGMMLVDNLAATYFHTRHLLLALRSGDSRELALALATEGGMRGALGGKHRAEADRILDRAGRLAADLGDPLAAVRVEMARMVCACYDGRWAAGVEHGERGLSILRERGVTGNYEATNIALAITIARFYLGDFAALRRHVIDTEARARRYGNLLGGVGVATGHGNAAWLAADDLERAEVALDDAATRWANHAVHMRFYDLLGRCQLDLYRGEPQRAVEQMRSLQRDVKRAGVMRLQRIRIEFRDLSGRIALAAGGGRAPATALRHAAELEREGAPWADALASLLRASATAAPGAYADAAARLDRLSMTAHADAARRREGELTGGDAGAALVAQADAALRAAGVAIPERMAAVLAPRADS
jgi:eukaryotic-like serine/threonine-protein kinase